MSRGETVAIKLPTLSPGSAASNELGFCCPWVPPAAAGPLWTWLPALDATEDKLAPAAGVVVFDEAAAGALFPAT